MQVTPQGIKHELAVVSAEMAEAPMTGDLLDARAEADRLLDLYIDSGFLASDVDLQLESD